MYKSRLSRDKVDPWQRPFYDVFWVPSCFQVLFEFQKALFKFFSWRVSSKQSYCFAFNETTFYAWWVARGEVRKLEGLSRLVKSFDWRVLIIILFIQDIHFCHGRCFRHWEDSLASSVVRYRFYLSWDKGEKSKEEAVMLKISHKLHDVIRY